MKKPSKKGRSKAPAKKRAQGGELRDQEVDAAAGGLGGDPDRPVIAGKR